MSSEITQALREFDLLDEEDYLIHPEHPNVEHLTMVIFDLSEKRAIEGHLSPEDKQRFHQATIAFDYYNETLEELAEELTDDDDDDDESFEE